MDNIQVQVFFSLARARKLIIGSYILSALAIFCVLYFHLLSALFSGLLMYGLIIILSTRTFLFHLGKPRARFIATSLLAVVIFLAVMGLLFAVMSIFHGENSAVPLVMQKTGEIVTTLNHYLPEWLAEQLPQNSEQWQQTATSWLKMHAQQLQFFGGRAGRSIVHIVFGLVIGALVALQQLTGRKRIAPLPRVLIMRLSKLSDAFYEIVFSQIKISAINAILTWIYLDGILVLTGYHLPLTKTLVILTFFFGLLPIIGNLITNTLIVLISLTHSFQLGVISLIFLVGVHKLEYFLNAKIIGSRIHASTWELLIAMLLMETLFGLPGVASAPIFYAYLKNELKAAKLI